MESIKKFAVQTEGNQSRWILTSGAVDRVGDRVLAEGVDLRAFLKNPVAISSHDYKTLPVGRWTNVRKIGAGFEGRIEANLEFPAPGLSADADEARGLVESGFLKTCSIGFQNIESKPNKFGGLDILKSELLEVSLVSVPANPEALRVAGFSGKAPALTVSDLAAAVKGAISDALARPSAEVKQAAFVGAVKAELCALTGRLDLTDGETLALLKAHPEVAAVVSRMAKALSV